MNPPNLGGMMTPPMDIIEVICPKCFYLYKDWVRFSINVTEEKMDDKAIEHATSSICPECGYKVRHKSVVVYGKHLKKMTSLL